MNIEEQLIKESIQLSRIILVKLSELNQFEKLVSNLTEDKSLIAEINKLRKDISIYAFNYNLNNILKYGLNNNDIKNLLNNEVKKLRKIYSFIKTLNDSHDKDSLIDFCFRTIEKIERSMINI